MDGDGGEWVGGSPSVYMFVFRVDVMPWQQEYAIQDTFEDGMVFVPDSPSCVYKLFRVHHCDDDPTHELAQVDANKCVLVPLRRMRPGEELTFDYFGRDDMVSSCAYCLCGQQYRPGPHLESVVAIGWRGGVNRKRYRHHHPSSGEVRGSGEHDRGSGGL